MLTLHYHHCIHSDNALNPFPLCPAQLSTAVTTGIGKPEAYVMCTVTMDQPMIFGGTEDPAGEWMRLFEWGLTR